jgi:Ser/Thr protein kinase RdoA (MazF antagonist)
MRDLTVQQLTDIFHEYSPDDLVEASCSAQAFANDVYEVTDVRGRRYFLKLLRAQSPEAITTEAKMQQRLLAIDIQTPEYLEVQPGSYVGSHDDVRFIISKRVPGRPPTSVTPALIESFGVTLAKLHDAFKDVVVGTNAMQWLSLTLVEHDLDAYKGDSKDDLVDLVNAGKRIFERGLPTTVIHGDLWMSNVFARDDRITTVFDLETAEHTVQLVDLARTYTSMKFNSDYRAAEIIERLITGYNAAATKPLNSSELANFSLAIAYVAGACGTWHAVHGTRYRDPYIQMGKEALDTSHYAKP